MKAKGLTIVSHTREYGKEVCTSVEKAADDNYSICFDYYATQSINGAVHRAHFYSAYYTHKTNTLDVTYVIDHTNE